jgi:hypothetical protein
LFTVSEGSRPLVSPFIKENLSRINFHKERLRPSYISQKALAKKEAAAIESFLHGRRKATLTAAEKKAHRDRHERLMILMRS